MNSNVTIVLNKDALNALFPEGTSARLELASSAIKAFATSTIKPGYVGEKVQQMVNDARHDAVAAVLKEQGATLAYNSRLMFSESYKKQLRDLATEELKKTTANAVKEAVAAATSNIPAMIEARLSNLLNDEVTRQVSARLKAAVEAALRLT